MMKPPLPKVWSAVFLVSLLQPPALFSFGPHATSVSSSPPLPRQNRYFPLVLTASCLHFQAEKKQSQKPFPFFSPLSLKALCVSQAWTGRRGTAVDLRGIDSFFSFFFLKDNQQRCKSRFLLFLLDVMKTQLHLRPKLHTGFNNMTPNSRLDLLLYSFCEVGVQLAEMSPVQLSQFDLK